MTNTRLLGLVSQVLTEIERQTQYCLRVALTPAQCPACHAMTSQVLASGLALDDFDATGRTKHTFHCPNCKRELVAVVPFFGPVNYRWKLAEPVGGGKDGE